MRLKRMPAKGGFRDGSGRKSKWGVPARTKRIPRICPDELLDPFLRMVTAVHEAGIPLEGKTPEDIIEAYKKLTSK